MRDLPSSKTKARTMLSEVGTNKTHTTFVIKKL